MKQRSVAISIGIRKEDELLLAVYFGDEAASFGEHLQHLLFGYVMRVRRWSGLSNAGIRDGNHLALDVVVSADKRPNAHDCRKDRQPHVRAELQSCPRLLARAKAGQAGLLDLRAARIPIVV